MINLNNSIFIEFCIDCKNHSWCTKHNEKKYLQFYQIEQH